MEEAVEPQIELIARALASGYAYYLQPHQDGTHAQRYAESNWRHFVEDARLALQRTVAA